MKKELRKKDIAVVGISGKFHGAKDADEFWENLINSKEMLYFYKHEELVALGLDETIIENLRYIPVESMAKNADCFDYSFFGYTYEEANLMDPQIRFLHEQVWLAMENAGCNPSAYNGKIGLYLSASNNLNWLAHVTMANAQNINPFFLNQISNKEFISTLISYNLNLQGPSYYSSTACSSSLTSIHLACRSLLMRECSLALAGGVSLETSTQIGYLYDEGMIDSKDGHCKAFDSQSSGCVKGNGGAIVALKRIEDAIKDKDHIYAIIRGTAANNDGKRKISYTAPSVIGQAECVALAHQVADVSHTSVSYIETHGTGTKLGDPIEIEALNKSFKNDTSFKCAIGSLKSNLGHLDAAAGVAGFIKTCLILKNKQIPASLHFTSPNPEIQFSEGPFYVNNKLVNVEDSKNLLIAGVSSFGVGGTNVHVVLEEYRSEKNKGKSRPFQLLPFSAKTESALQSYTSELMTFLDKKKGEDISDIAYTLKTGRQLFKYRSFALATNGNGYDGLIGKSHLKMYYSENKTSNIVFLFPGQGNQYYEMAKHIYNSELYFKNVMDQGFQILYKITGEKYDELLGYVSSAKEDIKTRINNTYYTQPLLFLIEYALAEYLIHLGIKPSNMIGHSLGEYTAACVAGVFSLNDALNILVKRAKLISDLEPGMMISVSLPVEKIGFFLSKNISIAAINNDNSVVLSGHERDINKVVYLFKKEEIPFSILNTSHAFHSCMMDPVLGDFENILKNFSFSIPKYPFVSNLTGRQIDDNQATSASYWVNHLRQTVNFATGMDCFTNYTNTIFIEVGPGKSLSSFFKQKRKKEHITTINIVRHPKEEVDDQLYLTQAIGELWANGIEINWEAYYSNEDRYKTPVPGYSFDNFSLDFKVDPYAQLKNSLSVEFGNYLYIRNWKKAPLKKDTHVFNKGCLFFSNGDAFSTQMITSLKTDVSVVEVRKAETFKSEKNNLIHINSTKKQDFAKLFEYLKNEGIYCDSIVFNWELQGDDQNSIQASFDVLLTICKQLIAYFPEQKRKISILSNFNYNILGTEQPNVNAITVQTIAKICAQENMEILTSSIDITPEDASIEVIDRIKDEIIYSSDRLNVAYRNKKRWVEFYENIDSSALKQESIMQSQKVYLITGGLGYLGGIIAKHIVSQYHAKVIITGTTDLPEENVWQNHLTDETVPEITKSRINKLKELKGISPDLLYYYKMDVADPDTTKKIIERITLEHGNISGIIHTAGIIDKNTFKLVENIDDEIVLKQFEPKINGTLNLYELFKDRNLDFMWISSSLASILGGLSYGAYATANKFIDAFVEKHAHEFKKLICINLDGLGSGLIGEKEIIDIFEKTHSAINFNQVIVSIKNLVTALYSKDQNKTTEEKASKKPTQNRGKSTSYAPPVSETEKSLAKIWEEFFGFDNISIKDNFFEMGGDSLKAMTLVKRINKIYQVEINLIVFFSKPNIKELAEEIDIAIIISAPVSSKQKLNSIKI